jgi:hypothetical protein
VEGMWLVRCGDLLEASSDQIFLSGIPLVKLSRVMS